MSSGLFVPIKEVPNFQSLLRELLTFLSGFFLEAGQLRVGVSLGGGGELIDSFVFVHDQEQEPLCWIGFMRLPEDSREVSEVDLPIVAEVTRSSKENMLFSVAVACAIGKAFGGRVIYDDAHVYFDCKKDVYTLLESEEYLSVRL
ncbi:uncharacterized protein POS17_2135 [Pseudomonas sp. Os17]|uniref:hypothetical protein n=1 Tax=Pseudomonas sp. Os17 TaxID=1500686 RepID=UPI0005FCABA3|nr:hypothetical protein [Pseudomonas sp. Os17]BAQ73829.1 uncharacterized protein POS17_2135 [Pseudomonas sp. Os17]